MHNFIIFTLCFIDRYRARYRFNKKSLRKLNWLSLIYNYFCVQIYLLIQIYTRYLSRSRKLLSGIDLYNFIIFTLCFIKNMRPDASLIKNLWVSSTSCPLSLLTKIPQLFLYLNSFTDPNLYEVSFLYSKILN